MEFYIIKLLHEYLKKKPLSKVTRKDYQNFINFRGKDASYNTVKRTHSYIQTAMKDALHDGLIDKDPTHNAVIYYENKPNNQRNHWNEQEFEELIKALRSEITLNNCMLIIQALTGLRIGEVYGLGWKDIDFENKTLSVNRGYDYLHEYDFTPGKNQSSIRKISISQDLINYLRQYKLKFIKYQPEYLFLNPLNRPEISCNGINKHLKKMFRECGIKELTSHSLRHTHCSVLLFNGLDIHYISKRLGHSNITETLKIYSHLLDEMKDKENEKALEVIENLGVQN